MIDQITDCAISPLDEREAAAMAIIRTKCAMEECASRATYLARYVLVSFEGTRSEINNVLCAEHAVNFCKANQLDIVRETPED